MRVLLVVGGLLAAALGIIPGASAQTALRDARPNVAAMSQRGAFTLRPEAGLRALAAEVAAVLELRTGAHVEVGEPPPPGLLEAVPAGHIALASTDSGIQLVLGTVGGRSLAAAISLPDGIDTADARALALTVESLHDTALDGHLSDANNARAGESSVQAQSPVRRSDTVGGVARHATRRAFQRRRSFHDEGTLPGEFWQPRFLRDVEALTFVRAYTGVSSASAALEAGIGGGLGVCAIRQCLVLAAELPVTEAVTADLRYRYNTYSVAFYSRPESLNFGDFTPGATLGLLTRVGHFNDDMGLEDEGLDTDLAARAGAELAWLVHDRLDVMLEAGADYLLDRFLLSDRGSSVARGERVTPWLQASVRVRPY